MDGKEHEVGKWDLLIAHPPCTYLSNVATRAYSLKCTPAEKVVARWAERAKAAIFFMRFALAPVDKICVENPVGFMNTAYRKADQLKGLAKLVGNDLPRPNNAELFGRHPNGKMRCWEEVQRGDRAKARSKTFPGIARAMAEQWGG